MPDIFAFFATHTSATPSVTSPIGFWLATAFAGLLFRWTAPELAAMASGASTADTHVKKRITPAAAPCSDFGTQLMPFELIVGYITDMNSPETGSRYTAQPTPLATRSEKQITMLPLSSASTPCQGKRVSSQAPTNRPAARRTKKIEIA
jgi:hypothetical protein